MYKVIFFDLGGVVFTNGTVKFIASLNKRYGWDSEKIAGVVNGPVSTLYREAKITREQFWDYVFKNLDLKESLEKLEEEWFSFYQPIPQTKELIHSLSRKYKVFYLSDHIPERVQYLDQKYGFLNWFNGGVFSFEVGARKPNLLIFQAALGKAQVQSQEVVFIHDKEKNVEAAKKLGMKTILFETPEKLKEEFKKLGVSYL